MANADEYPCLGTEDEAEIWCNVYPGGEATFNLLGTYLLILYADAAVVYFCFVTGDWDRRLGYGFMAVSGLLIWAHLKTMLTDPGATPKDAMACGDDKIEGFCAKCDRFKPTKAYHCSKCKRCVSRMDHHCPYTNNCVGAKNQKHMILFLLYCNIQSVFALALVAYYGAVKGYLWDDGWPNAVLTGLLGVDGGMTLLFTGTMMRRQVISIITGIGTIDRLKLAKGKPIAGGTPVPLSSIFGHTWLFWLIPLDPDFSPEVEEDILGYRLPNGRRNAQREPIFSNGPNSETPLFAEERKEPE